ncbi:MAG: CBS domain-containing protein [Anaerolineae bacterium]|jgi:CBS domain-containing protein|nr:CBS domain-containing protein [Anaerolineae bacterium]
MRVQEILMTKGTTVITITPEASVMAASQRLAEKNIGALVVVDANQRPIGILSERDIVRWVAKQGVDVFSKPVSAIMTKDLIVATPQDEIEYLTNTMTARRIRHLPVIDDEELVGMITIGDVVKAQLVQYEGEVHTLRHHLTE